MNDEGPTMYICWSVMCRFPRNFVHDSKCFKCIYKILYMTENDIFEVCTLHLSNFTTYPDVRYISSTDAILIQTRCVQSVFSLEKWISAGARRSLRQQQAIIFLCSAPEIVGGDKKVNKTCPFSVH